MNVASTDRKAITQVQPRSGTGCHRTVRTFPMTRIRHQAVPDDDPTKSDDDKDGATRVAIHTTGTLGDVSGWPLR